MTEAGDVYKRFRLRRRAQGLCRCGQKLAQKGTKKLSRCRACLDKASACAMRRKEGLRPAAPKLDNLLDWDEVDE